MVTELYKATFHGHGFDLDNDISSEMREKVIAEFMAMYNAFANMSNQVIEKINALWDNYECVKNTNDVVSTAMMRESMDITKDTDYNDWVEKWFKEIAEGVDAMARFSKFMLKSHIFRDGDIPVYGVEFIDHPNWTLDFTLEPAS